jgi:DNA-binding NarL/FixJ family response regulator
MRLLLVDDDPEFRSTLRYLLRQHTEVVIVGEAGDGSEVLPLIAPLRPEVVLMDLTMPRMNGIEATRQLKRAWAELPVVMLTVHADPAYHRAAEAAGAAAVLEKKTLGMALWPTLLRITARGSQGAAPLGNFPGG